MAVHFPRKRDIKKKLFRQFNQTEFCRDGLIGFGASHSTTTFVAEFNLGPDSNILLMTTK